MTTVLSVLIAGGGIGGLALAIAARRHGLEAIVLERSAEPVEAGSGLVLSPNGMKALAALGPDVAAEVRAAGYSGGLDHYSAFVTSRGKTLSSMSFKDMDASWGAPVVSLRRSRLHGVLSEHARRAGAEVRLGIAVRDFTDLGGRVRAAGIDGDVLVGCDGLRSAVRRRLLGDGDPGFLGYTAVRGLGPAPAELPYGFIAYGRGLILFGAPVEDGRLYWVASISAPVGVWPSKLPRVAHHDLLGLLADWSPGLVGVVAGADPDELVLTDIYDRDPVPTWSRGRATLLGDAAHPMAYTMGQGANLTLEDAVTLAHHLASEPSLERALAAYEEARIARTAKIVKTSRMFGRVGQVRHPLAAWGRDRLMSIMSRFGDPDKQNADLYGWEPPGASAADQPNKSPRRAVAAPCGRFPPRDG